MSTDGSLYDTFFASRARPIEKAGEKNEEKKKEKNSKEASRRGSERFQSFHQLHLRESLRGFSSSTNLADLDLDRIYLVQETDIKYNRVRSLIIT